MDVADRVLWQYADEQKIVPVGGLHEVPGHIRADLSGWLRRQASPCPHSVALALTGVVFRVAGQRDAWCPVCAAEADIAEMTKTCAGCARPVGGRGRALAFTLAGHVIVYGAWCAGCWSREEET